MAGTWLKSYIECRSPKQFSIPSTNGILDGSSLRMCLSGFFVIAFTYQLLPGIYHSAYRRIRTRCANSILRELQCFSHAYAVCFSLHGFVALRMTL